MNVDLESVENHSDYDNSNNVIEEGEIQEILELDGVEVWGQPQNVLEQQALNHLQSLTEESQDVSGNKLEDGEIKDDESVNKGSIKVNGVQSSILDINKYLASQDKLNQSYIRKKTNSVSDKSRSVAKKISEAHLQKNANRKAENLSSCGNAYKKCRKDSEVSNNSAESAFSDQIVIESKEVTESKDNSGSEYFPSDEFDSDGDFKSRVSGNKRKRSAADKCEEISERIKDDGLLQLYTDRLANLTQNKEKKSEDVQIEDGLKITESIWEKLYSYQQDGIKWLWEIHKQNVGGLLGDEMGLGKTVQVIVFLAALEYSKITSSNGRYTGLGPSIIVCPATVIHQWVKHFHDWWPFFRVALLHQSGSFRGNKMQLINDINKTNGILVTTYESVLKYKGVLTEKKWHYVILDEGHKIRNPSAKVTVAVKQFRTPHKIILTGSPMQNNLQELWSLFDFIVPGKLGSHQAFMDYFANPITQGGFANATPTQETTALLIATSLKSMITPFMLRRTKNDVQDSIYLPNKSEQVLFCSLTDEQRDLYRGFLLSDHIGSILGRTSSVRYSDNHMRANILVGITTLRKICNHPDLYLGQADDYGDSSKEVSDENSFGYYKRSGKMVVVAALLKIWKRQKHRVLLFTQTRAVVDIFEDFLGQQGYKYLKMDGGTNVSNRQMLIDNFNRDESYDVFLLTTRVGGLGVNLIGANRVIIYDPDWNPATDTQARERAWRIGQMRQVTIYRLVSAGTIEEKMYQRQVWKQLLSNKILIDPKTKRFFKTSDLSDLFSFQEHTDTNPETANIFRNSKVEITARKKSLKSSPLDSAVTFSEDKIQAMKSLAQQIAKNLSQNPTKKDENSKTEEKIEQSKPSPTELLAINRKKLKKKEEPIVNKIDDKETNNSFADALCMAEKTAKEYHKRRKVDEVQAAVDKSKSKKEKKEKERVKVDQSGQIDGEKIEGLLKREIKKREKVPKTDNNQDQYVLEKLFSKKGVHTALQHDVIVQAGYKNQNNLKIHCEAKKKADMALKALRKSRLSDWRW